MLALAPLLLNCNTSRPSGLLACGGGSAAQQRCTLSRFTNTPLFWAAAARQHCQMHVGGGGSLLAL